MQTEQLAAADETLVHQITEALNESNRPLVRKIIQVIGPERTLEFLQTALAIEANGGLLVRNGKRRRTPGGTFFYTVRGNLPKHEQRQIWLRPPKASRPSGQAQPLVAPTWEEAKQLISQAIQQIGEAKTVKLTLVGRPGKIVEQEACIVVSMKGKEPPSLPKGLPTPPASGAITWVVFIAKKQWNKVKDSLHTHPEDQLIIEGWPGVDPKRGIAIVLTTNCRSVHMERAQRPAPPAKVKDNDQ